MYGLGSDPAIKKEIADRDAHIEELKEQVLVLETEAVQRESHISFAEEELSRVKHQLEQYRETMRNEMVRVAKQTKAEARRVLHQKHFELGHIVTWSGTGKEMWVEGNSTRDLIMQRDEVKKRRDEVEVIKKAAHATLKQLSRAEKDDSGGSVELTLMEAQEELQLRTSEHTALTNALTAIELRREELESEKKVFQKEIRRLGDEDASEFMCVPYFGENHRYVLMRLLGKGGFAEVWQAFDLTEGRYVACKIHKLHADWPNQRRTEYIRHTERELEIMRQVHHPHVTQLYDVFEFHTTTPPTTSFVSVMEFSRGMDLDTYLKRYRTLREADARLILLQIVGALRYLASMNTPIIHYDLKPANILLHSDDPSVFEIKITDFGLSKIITKSSGLNANPSIELTSPGSGTYWYQPPECFGTQHGTTPLISNKVDVWSVGVMFYQMLYGRRPFAEGHSQTDIWYGNLIVSSARSLTFPNTPKVSDEARDLISKCLAFSTSERYDIFQLSQDPYLFRVSKKNGKSRTTASSADAKP